MNKFFRNIFRMQPAVEAPGSPQGSPGILDSPSADGFRQVALFSEEKENQIFIGGGSSSHYRSRLDYDRQKVLAECLRAWRVNPLARRVVSLQTDFIIGEGLGIQCDHKATHKFLLEWWRHPLNDFDSQLPDWCDELARSGNLFFILSANPMDGMTYVRPLPADSVREIVSAPNDVRQELQYLPEDTSAEAWEAYNGSDGQPTFVLHFAVNRPVGSPWGEPMLAPMLDDFGRYRTWLEDRARLNHFRSAFLYVVQGAYSSEADRQTRENHINSHQPNPGSILVVNDSEKWSTISPQLNSGDATQDGLSLKKTIAAGAGIPLHYLAEPESSTRTTAEAAGTPAFRGLERTQKQFLAMLRQMARIAVAHRRRFDRRLNPRARIQVLSPDITERDNSLLSLAAARILPSLMDLFDRRLIDSREALRLYYRMAGETFDQSLPAPEGDRRPLWKQARLPLPKTVAEDGEPEGTA